MSKTTRATLALQNLGVKFALHAYDYDPDAASIGLQAAEALGRSRSDFMLDTVCREAEAVLLDRRYFALSAEDFARFASMLDKPPKDNPKLRRLLEKRPPWER